MTDGRPRRFKALLFDLYDTLIWVDAPASNRWRRQFAERAGVPLDLFMETWRRSVNDRMRGIGGAMADHLSATLRALGIDPAPTLVADMIDLDRRRLEETTHLYPNSVPVLRRLAAAGYRLGLLSNVSDSAALPIMHLGVDRLFHDMVLSHEVGLLKPDPAIYDLACRRLEAAPEETMFVADGGFGELDTSHRLGIFSVLLQQDHQSPDFGFSTSYDVEIHDLLELEGLLSRLEQGQAER